MKDETIVKIAIIFSLTSIAIVGLLLNRIDVAVITTIIGFIGGYAVGESRSRKLKEEIREKINQINEILGTTDNDDYGEGEDNENEAHGE
jgi:hypothetical protein